MPYSFNTTTATTLAGVAIGTARILSINESDGTGKIDVTGSGSGVTQHEYEATLDDPEITIEVLGGDGFSRGDTGATSITWGDGTSTTITNSITVGKQMSGSIDDRIVYTITIVPTPA